MLTKVLQKAREYEKKAEKKIPEGQRPSFHLSPRTGWMNDPNGFSFFDGKYHMFYQYYPYATYWGPMHWGHAVSKDLVRWEYLPVVLAPDQQYDKDGCFSGSAVGFGNSHALIYTGVEIEKQSDGRENVKQVQCVASGDGVNYQKWECNPVVSPEIISEPVSMADFRDPKVWKHENTYYMVVGCCDENKMGRIAMFSSLDLKEWKYDGMIARNDGSYGRMWECPDFFAVDGIHMLIASPQDMRKKNNEFHSGNGTIYLTGEFDYESCNFQHGEAHAIDYGLDFYAPQTTMTEDGRRVMVAWMKSWDINVYPGESLWNGMMTLPRELHVKEAKLLQSPVRELKNYYADEVIYSDITLTNSMELHNISGRELNLEIEVKDGEYKIFEIQFAKNKDYKVSCKYEPETGVFSFDRSNSEVCRDIVNERKMDISCAGARIKIQIILGKYSAEIFINDGEQVMTSVFFIPMEAEDITFIVDGSLTADITKNKIEMKK